MPTSFVPQANINVVLNPAPTAENPSKTTLLIGQRLTGGDFLIANSGYPQPNLYVPFLLPAFSDGASAISYLKKLGLKCELSISFTQDLPSPDSVTNVGGVTSLVWDIVPLNFDKLAGMNLSGVLSQGLLTADVKSAEIITVSSTLKAKMIVYGNVAFVDADHAGEDMTLSGINNVQYPDPVLSDPICCMVWDFYQTATSAFNSPLGAPQALVSIVSDRDDSISPTATPIALVAPNLVQQTSGTAVLRYAQSDANLGYLPTTALGITTVTQATSGATGTYGGYVVNGNNLEITVTDVTGTFDDTNTVSVVLDVTANVGLFLENIEVPVAVMQYPVIDEDSVTTTHADYFTLIDNLNQSNALMNQHFGTIGLAGNITSLPPAATSLPNINDRRYQFITYPYVPQFGNVPYDNSAGTLGGGRVAASVAYMIANQDAPFDSLTNAYIAHLPVSSKASTTSYSRAPQNTGDFALQQGWTPLVPNNSGIGVQFLNCVTSMTTIPDTTIPDIEYRYTHIWQSIYTLRKNIYEIWAKARINTDNTGVKLITPDFLDLLRSAIMSMMTGQTYLINVNNYINKTEVKQSQIDPEGVEVLVYGQFAGANNKLTGIIDIYSVLTNIA